MPDINLLWQLLGAFLLLASSAVGNPIPEEVMIAGVGVQAANIADRYSPYHWLLLPAAMLGAVLTDVVLYVIGRVFGARLLEHKWLAKLAPPEKRERTRQNFHHYGVSILVFGRLVPGIRTTLFLTAGMMRLPVVRFCIADGLGAVLGNSLLFFLGYWLGTTFLDFVDRLEKQAKAYEPGLLLLLIIAVLTYLVVRMLRRPFATGDPEELPVIGQKVAATIDKLPEVPLPKVGQPGSPEAKVAAGLPAGPAPGGPADQGPATAIQAPP